VGRIRLVLWPVALAVGIAAESSQYGWSDWRGWVPDLVAGWSLVGCGLVGWSRRRESRSGALMAATGFAWFAPNFATTGVNALDWLSAHALYLHRGPLVQLVLTYPRGRAVGRLERAALAVGYAAAVVTPIWRSEVGTIVLSALLITVAIAGYFRAVGRERRMRLSAVRATTLLAAGLAAIAWIRLTFATDTANAATLHAYQAALCVLSLGLLAGLFLAPWDRAPVTDLVVDLGETRSVTLRDALARALGDPSLQVGYWLEDFGGFVDSAGRPLRLPDSESERSMTMIEWDGGAVAVLVHDPAVLSDQGLVEAVSSAAELAAANARLQADVRARLAEITTSRRRILEAEDEERGRLACQLRAGAQRRLDELAETLRGARASAGAEPTIERIAQSESQLARTRDDLRRLARGIHPRELSEQGLAAGLASLTNDFPLPVQLALPAIDASASVQACMYFVCSEALANVAKYASASRVAISVSSSAGDIVTVVEDDGVGGADPNRGTGLRGLADRVEAFGGTLTVDSPPGRGTRLVAVIPEDADSA
jgi:signal transduction histidine kinase